MTQRYSRTSHVSLIALVLLLLPAIHASALAQAPIWSGITDVASFDAAVDAHLAAAQQAIEHMLAVKGPGGSMSANDLVRHFLGRPQSMDAMKRWMSEEFAATPAP